MKNIAVLLTVHNRKLNTLNCLRRLYKTDLPFGFKINVYLVDDGCTDGTADAVEQEFPEIHIIKGDGTLFWNRGMIKAWEYASQAFPDFFLWLNDDTYLFSESLTILITAAQDTMEKSIIVGTTCSASTNKATYGGRRGEQVIEPNGTLQYCKTFNGNCVLIPKNTFNKLGNLDHYFRHSFGDIEYGLRAAKNNISSVIAPNYIGICERHAHQIKCFRAEENITNRLRHFYSPLGMNPFEFFYLNYKHRGLLIAIKTYLSTHLRVFFPQLWDIKIKTKI